MAVDLTALDTERDAPPTRLVAGPGSTAAFEHELRSFGARRVLVVASAGALRRTSFLSRVDAPDVRVFTGFSPNPDLDDVLKGCAARDAQQPGLIVGLGGGSAMDAAKMIRLLPAGRDRARAALAARAPVRAAARTPLVLIPTTAGTGSEVTQFATVFVDGLKQSLDLPAARATVALVDPVLTHSCPWEVSASCAFDALAHALESYWSVRSTPRSRELAATAAEGIADVLRGAGGGFSESDRQVLSSLSTRAGQAIDLTRTTVGHAFAYPLTVHFGVPHGLACVLSLSWLFPLSESALAGPAACQDPRGADFVRARLQRMAGFLGAGSPRRLGQALRSLITAAGFPDTLGAYGVRKADVPVLFQEAMSSSRSSNTPVQLPADAPDYLAAHL